MGMFYYFSILDALVYGNNYVRLLMWYAVIVDVFIYVL